MADKSGTYCTRKNASIARQGYHDNHATCPPLGLILETPDSSLFHHVKNLHVTNPVHVDTNEFVVKTRRVPVQRAVERAEIPYPYASLPVQSPRHDAASPIKYNYKIDHSRA